MKTFRLFFLAIILMATCSLSAQIAINTDGSEPHNSAMLDVKSTDKGLLPPRMTASQRDAISIPAKGLVIFNTTSNCINYYNGSAWFETCGTKIEKSAQTGSTLTSFSNYSENFSANTDGHNKQNLSAQVAINTDGTSADASAMLDVKSTDKGLLPPRMTTTQRNAINSPAVGLVIFNTTTNCINYYNGSDWSETCGTESAKSAQLGSTFTTFSNGFQNFSANTTCQNKLISAGHTASTCSGTVAIGTKNYNVVLINGQCWMKENLDEIPSNYNPSPDWVNNTDKGWHGYYTGGPFTNEGRLYQWSAAMNSSTTERAQGVCPAGWHIPSDCEWKYLEHGLLMSIADQNKTEWRSSGGVGGKLKTGGSTGFDALFAGMRASYDGSFSNHGTFGFWWSSSVENNTAFRRSLYSGQSGVYRENFSKAFGKSVRCLKD